MTEVVIIISTYTLTIISAYVAMNWVQKSKKKEVPVFSQATVSASSVTKVETTFVNPPTVATPKSLADVRAVLTKIDGLTMQAKDLKNSIADLSAPDSYLGLTTSKVTRSRRDSGYTSDRCYKDHVTYKLPDDLLQVVKKALVSEREDLLKQIKELEASVTASITTGENDR